MGQNTPADEGALKMLEQAIKDVSGDIGYYSRLAAMAQEPSDKEVIRHVMMDEEKHKMLLEKIYESISGRKFEAVCENKSPGKNMICEYEINIFHKLEAADFYRKIYFIFLNIEIRDILYEIIGDEFSNAQKFTYLYAKYR